MFIIKRVGVDQNSKSTNHEKAYPIAVTGLFEMGQIVIYYNKFQITFLSWLRISTCPIKKA